MTTPWLALNGINLGSMAGLTGAKGQRRDIGEEASSVDGSLVVTRSKRKHDLSFDSVPLAGADAFAWESLIIGEGEVWSFNDSLYGSKGLGPSAVTGAARGSSPAAKFGTDKLRVPGSTGTITYAGAGLNSAGVDNGSTVMVWRLETGWHHYTITSDGACWYDGARADGTAHAWLVFGSAGTGDITITHSGSTDFDYDDLVVLPFRVLDDWPPVWGVATVPFSRLPILNASGAMVRENFTLAGAVTRPVLGACADAAVLVGRRGTAMQHDLRRLAIELKEV